MNQQQAQDAKYQVRTETGHIVSASGTFAGIDAFLDRFADGTGRADYEVLGRTQVAGNHIYTVRAI